MLQRIRLVITTQRQRKQLSTVDKQRPTVTISDLPSGEENDAFDLTITFSEDVTGFATADLTRHG